MAYDKHMDQFLSTLPARGATAIDIINWMVSKVFLSTLPARGATAGQQVPVYKIIISIHAPREGSDVYRDVITLYHI